MRLFIAVNFQPEVKAEITDIQRRLGEYAHGGNFTLYENLHLTLVFLGEINPGRLKALRRIMDAAQCRPFRLTMSGAGCFSRGGGDIWWLGIEKNTELSRLQKKLSEDLLREGFEVERREFRPHLTLAREVRLRDDFDSAAFSRGITAIGADISRISLMRSERAGGRLVYTEIYGKELDWDSDNSVN